MDSTAWDERYAASDLVWSVGPNVFLPPVVESLVPGSALDVACGEGRNAIWLARQGWAVTGVDFSPVALAKANRLSPDVEIEWVVSNVVSYTPERTFDLVIVFYLHLDAPDFVSVISHAVDALAPGGTLFGVGHAVANLSGGYGGPQVPEILWSKEMLAPMLEHLEVIELSERTRFVPGADSPAIDLVFHAINPPT